jgi:hypothetical protein
MVAITKNVVLTVGKGLVKAGLPVLAFGLNYFVEQQRMTDKINKIVAETLKNAGVDIIQKVEP